MSRHQFSKTKFLNLVKQELNEIFETENEINEAGIEARKTTPEGVPAIPRGKVPTERQSGIERSTAAILNGLLSRVEELEKAGEDTRKLLHQMLKSMGVEI